VPGAGWWPRVLRPAFYLVVGALFALAVTDRLDAVLPAEAAKDVGEDSEALLLALMLAGWIEFARPRLRRAANARAVTAAAATACLVLGSWLFLGEAVPRPLATFGEPVLAMALLLPYLQLRRPLPRRLVAVVPATALLLLVAASASVHTTRAAEALAVLVLVPLGLDVFDRRILEPSVRTPAALRWSWYLVLIAMPLVLSEVLRDAVDGPLRHAVGYAVGLQEAWLGVLLVHLYAASAYVAGTPWRRLPAPR
jgi:hypothetical protein